MHQEECTYFYNTCKDCCPHCLLSLHLEIQAPGLLAPADRQTVWCRLKSKLLYSRGYWQCRPLLITKVLQSMLLCYNKALSWTLTGKQMYQIPDLFFLNYRVCFIFFALSLHSILFCCYFFLKKYLLTLCIYACVYAHVYMCGCTACDVLGWLCFTNPSS